MWPVLYQELEEKQTVPVYVLKHTIGGEAPEWRKVKIKLVSIKVK